MKGFETPVIIGFPLRGEWMAPNTPGKRSQVTELTN